MTVPIYSEIQDTVDGKKSYKFSSVYDNNSRIVLSRIVYSDPIFHESKITKQNVLHVYLA